MIIIRFGKSYEEITQEVSDGSGGNWLKYFKEDVTTFRIVQEPNEWVGYWEHFNPSGYPFPCTGDRSSCPGCTSSNEKMKKASRKIAIQVLEGDFVNVYKVAKTVADKLANRAERLGTVTDRDYTIFKIKSKNSDGSTKTDYDVEGGDKIPVDLTKIELKDVESMLQDAYDQSWGDGAKSKETEAKAEYSGKVSSLAEKLQRAKEAETTETPSTSTISNTTSTDQKMESTTASSSSEASGHSEEADYDYSEDELRQLNVDEIRAVIKKEGLKLPNEAMDWNTDKIVDWLLEQE